jgi:hypothetical protein
MDNRAMDREHVLREIRRTAAANGGTPVGLRRFEEETGIRYHDWYGQFWSKWSDAVREAGFQPNQMTEAYGLDVLFDCLVVLTRKLGRVPTVGDLVLATNNDPNFPSEKSFRRLGRKPERVSRVIEFCTGREDLSDVLALWESASLATQKTADQVPLTSAQVGYVYLLQHGSRREYKIGRTNNPIRREGELGIQLPEKLQPVHYIETDDPAGIEAYWHSRFASRRKEGEWFSLSASEVQAFKRWRKIY